MGPSHLPRTVLALISRAMSQASSCAPAKLFDTRTFFPLFCPSRTPRTRFFVPFPDLEKWSAAERRTRGATETVQFTSESVSVVVAGIVLEVTELNLDYLMDRVVDNARDQIVNVSWQRCLSVVMELS